MVCCACEKSVAAPLQDGLPISGIQVGTVNPLSSHGVVATQEQVNVPMNEAIHAVVPRPDALYTKCGAGRW